MLMLKHVLTFQTLIIERQSSATHIQQALLLKTYVVLIANKLYYHANLYKCMAIHWYF